MSVGLVSVILAWVSALLAGVLSFASPKESSQRKGDPEGGAGRSPVPCATRHAGAAAELGLCPQTVLAEGPPAYLRCSAPSTGTRKASGFEQYELNLHFHGEPEKQPKNEIHWSLVDALPGPLRGAEQRRNAGGCRLALFEPQASLASRPAFRVAQGTGAAGTDLGVAFSLATFFWPHKRKYARQQGGTPRFKHRTSSLNKHQNGASV